tara:strand:+ start:749 stop:1747 length:999 start_codon:yes stop_codon:yes gene_type:complete
MRNLNQQGVQFEIHNESSRGRISSYGSKPHPYKLNKAEAVDINGLPSSARVNVADDFSSIFTIGMEFEKNRFHRSAVQEYPLLCGFEHDGSCGAEAVTHILPLVDKSMWRTKVFNMFHQAKKIINDEFSPSNRKCGGHITLGVKDMSGRELSDRMKKFSGLVYAIYRHRVNNYFCRGNITMDTSAEWSTKYTIANYKTLDGDGVVEFRVPSRFTSVKQTIRRYEFFYQLIDFAVNKQNSSLHHFCNAVKPILLSMFNNDAEKVAKTIALAKKMQKVINGSKMDLEMVGWFEGWWSNDRELTYQFGGRRGCYKRGYTPNEYTDVRKFKEEFYF